MGDFFCFMMNISQVISVLTDNTSMVDSLKYFKKLARTAQIGWWSYKIGDTHTTWSDETYEIHAVPKGEKPDVESGINFYVPEDRPRITELFKRCIEQSKSFEGEFGIIDRNGVRKTVKAIGQAEFDGDKVVEVFGTFQDITQNVHMRDSNKLLYRSLIEQRQHMDEITIVAETDSAGVITYVNDKFCEISGYDRSELIGNTHRMVNSGYHPKEFFKDLWSRIQTGKHWRGKVCNRAKDGSLYWVETFIAPKIDEKGKVTGFVSFRYDITEQKKLEEQIQEQQELATISAQMASVGEFAASISHEIANPLTIIHGRNSQLLACKDNPERVEKIHQAITKAVDRISKIINGMKKLSYRSQSEGYEIHPLAGIIKETVEFSAEFLKNKGIELKLHQDIDDVLIECHDVQVSQILLNLIKNAKDAIVEANSAEKWIKLAVLNQGENISIEVSDSGPGVPEDIRHQIMVQFFTTKAKGYGNGLGLSLVRRLVKEHHGEFYLKSDSRNTFVVVLPKSQFKQNAA